MASVSITVVFGDNGILQLAKEAGEKTNATVKNEQSDIQNLATDIDDIINPPIDISKVKGKVTQNTKVSDKYGNKLTIPAGFEIVQNGTEHVEYTYDKDESGEPTGIPTVQDGIVIKDDENYFVWIPIGTIKNRAEDEERGETSEIILGRYDFEVGEYDENNKTFKGNGDAYLIQNALDYLNTSDSIEISGGYKEFEDTEINNATYGNVKAKNLGEFITKTKEKGGYYLARYEAVKGEDSKVKSKPSTVEQATDENQEITSGMVWTKITQPNAADVSRNMYDLNNKNFQSDLVNSYAWDTALVFISKYSGQTNYSIQNSKNTENVQKTGERGNTTDKVCNIYDMASNVLEYSTETAYGSPEAGRPCTVRGGVATNMTFTSSRRHWVWNDRDWTVQSFRPILYLTK